MTTIQEKQTRASAMKEKATPHTPIPLESLSIVQPNPPVAVMLAKGLDPTKPISEQTS